jgi:uncharacterized surface protein with fasciclin (FAS1) repeats
MTTALLHDDIVATGGKAGSFTTLVPAVKADIETSNGVIHVIDTVLLPAASANTHR